MHFSLDQLAIFVAAARGPSFSAIARSMGKAQSAVSAAISDLEADLGVTLFDRSGRYPVLTPEGASLVQEAEAVLSHCNSLQARANAISGDLEAAITIAIEDACPYIALKTTLENLQKQFSGTRVHLRQPMQDDVVTMLLKGDVDIGLGCARAHYPAGIGFCRLGNVTLVNAARRDHVLASRPAISFAEIADHTQILFPAQTKHLLTSEYLKTPRQWTVESYVALIELLRGGLGWAIVPKRLIEAELASGELVELALEAYPFTEWRVGLDLLWNIETRLGRVTSWLKTELSHTKVDA
jgi:DNA-binding transcriptional LysR family regulator